MCDRAGKGPEQLDNPSLAYRAVMPCERQVSTLTKISPEVPG